MKRTIARFFASAGVTAVLVGTAGAETDADRIAALEDNLAKALAAIAELTDTVKQLETALAEDDAPASKTLLDTDTQIEELDLRLTDLEDIAIDVDERLGSRAVVRAFDSLSLDFGGFFDIAGTVAFGEDDTEGAFSRQVAEILVKAELGEDWEFFLAQAFVRNAALGFEDEFGRFDPFFGDTASPVVTDTVIAWGQYSFNDALNVQAGRFVTPQGIINIEHFPATLLDPEQPLFLRPFTGDTIFANFTDGVNIFGDQFIGEAGNQRLSYNVYGGAFSGDASQLVVGGRLAYGFVDQGLTFGLNLNSGAREQEPGTRFGTLGADVLYDKGRWLWKTEVFATSEGDGPNRFAAYTQPGFRFTDRIIGFYRFDYLDTGGPGEQTFENVWGLVYNPIPNVRLRSIARWQRFLDDGPFPQADLQQIQLSATFSF
ncbi:MAG: hypothetical protein ACFB2Z_01265 [Maricaulaceae bacterium]